MDAVDNSSETSLSSALSCIAAEYLYLLPPHAGDVLVARNLKMPTGKTKGEWLKRILSWSADELMLWTEREGDEEDKMIFIDVFLWKQRHGLIERSRRIDYVFHEPSYAWYLNRYMVANGNSSILEKPQSEGRSTGYLTEIESLLDRFNDPGFNAEDLWNLLLGLNVLGPQLHQYRRRSEVLNVAEYILQRGKEDVRVQFGTQDDVEFARLAQLLFDLKLDPNKTWPYFKEFFSSNHGVACYPTLVVGLEMYGDLFLEAIQSIQIQGGKDLFFELVGRSG